MTHWHSTHFDDCGCLSARKDAEIAHLAAEVARLESEAERTPKEVLEALGKAV